MSDVSVCDKHSYIIRICNLRGLAEKLQPVQRDSLLSVLNKILGPTCIDNAMVNSGYIPCNYPYRC